MKSKQNVTMRFVFATEEYNRVVAVYSSLINIDKRISKNSKNKKSSKKFVSKKNKEQHISMYICNGQGSRKKSEPLLSLRKQ